MQSSCSSSSDSKRTKMDHHDGDDPQEIRECLNKIYGEGQFAVLSFDKRYDKDESSINLSSWNIDDDQLVFIIESICKWLTRTKRQINELDLSENQITSAGASTMFMKIREMNLMIKSIVLMNNNLDDTFMSALGKCLQSNQHIKSISIRNLKYLEEFDHDKVQYNLQMNKITDEGVKLLSDHILENSGIERLDIEGFKEITGKSSPFLVKIIKASNLIEIVDHDASCAIKEGTAILLAQNILRMKSRQMHISSSGIDDEALAQVCELMKENDISNLKEIALNSNIITSKGASLLLSTLKECQAKVEKLGLNSNNLDNDFAIALCDFIKENQCLRELDLSYNKSFTKSVLSKIKNTAKRHKVRVDVDGILKENKHNGEFNILKYQIKDQGDIIKSRVSNTELNLICKYMKQYGIKNLKDINFNLSKLTSKGATILFKTLKECKSQVRSIDLGNCSIDDACIEPLGEFIQSNQRIKRVILGNHVPFRRCTLLGVGHNHITTQGLQKLSTYIFGHSSLKYLDFRSLGWGFSNELISSFINMIETSSLEMVHMEFENYLKYPFAAPLIVNKLRSRTNEISFSSCEISDDDAEKICEGMKKYGVEKLEKIELVNAFASSKGLHLIVSTLKELNSNIKMLIISNNKLDDESMEILGDFISNSKVIQNIDLNSCDISDDGIAILSKYLIGNTTLKYVTINHNVEITEKSMPMLAKIIESSNIEWISFTNASISSVGVLNALLTVNQIKIGKESIVKMSSSLTDESIVLICDAIKKYGMQDVKEINLCSNNISSKGASLLFDTLRECEAKVEKLNLNSNRIDDRCMESLGKYIEINPYLANIDVGSNYIADRGIATLLDYMVGNVTVKNIRFEYNQNITGESIPYFIDLVKNSGISSMNVNSTFLDPGKIPEIQRLCEIPIEQREIPIKSNTKSAAKLS